MLTTGQTVIPPTKHAETGRPYEWGLDCALLDVHVDDLPELPADIIEQLEVALRPWLPPAREYARSNTNGASSPSHKRLRAYAEAALDGEVRNLRSAPKGGRNRQLFDAACRLGKYVHHTVLSESELEDALLDAANSNGLVKDDGLSPCKKTFASALRKSEGDELPILDDRRGSNPRANGADPPIDAGQKTAGKDGPRRTQADALIEIATGEGVELYHSPDGTTFADVNVNGHRETWPTKSNGFRRWLRRAYFQRTKGAPNSDAMSTALALIEARAQFDGANRPVHLRVAAHGEFIYIDLCDKSWRAIEIDGDGWRVVSAPPVRFRRTPGMQALPTPLLGGKLEELKKHLNLSADAYALSVGWLLQVLRGRGPYPILALNGEQGAGKTTAADRLRRLVDPHSAGMRALPRDVRDLAIAANNAHVLAFDNLSGIPADVADALCRLSTGGGIRDKSALQR